MRPTARCCLAALALSAALTVLLMAGAARAQQGFADYQGSESWPAEVEDIRYPGGDGTLQPAMFYKPPHPGPRPLLVALHTWSHGYRQQWSVPYADWCIEQGWVLIHPHMRGPNSQPEATASDLAISDIIAAVDYARRHSHVDRSRIYLAGYSSGGLAALRAAAAAPGIWAGVTVWGAVTDLQAWHHETAVLGLTKYLADLERSVGGPPLPGSTAADECRRRSPVTYLAQARSVPIDLNAGLLDGRGGQNIVPVSHSLRAFNLLAAPADRLAEADLDALALSGLVPDHLRQEAPPDPSYGQHRVLFRRRSGNVRLTLFLGGHVMLYKAAMGWLSQQRAAPEPLRRRPAVLGRCRCSARTP